MFKLDTQSLVLANQVKQIPTSSYVINRINVIGEARDQPNGIKFSTMDYRVSVWDLELNQNDDSNASINSFVPNEKYEKKFNDELNLDRGPNNDTTFLNFI